MSQGKLVPRSLRFVQREGACTDRLFKAIAAQSVFMLLEVSARNARTAQASHFDLEPKLFR
jgi:hypothetical protein